ncbi:MAG: bifunctional phosphoribosylaminoimidazolecarboxamide formyltransferase/IMP cyclohydrolase [Prevotellaceae bacterium]|jgi:phosphoribosylaminoimidazolecarboxamide formyltransferase/IMP cyclohydrolase|nr:bifunctional phosphoribosylaminoimidazolecarboxamide formyltransferase/IMP cyclohydrolase [Prevotellaceae bacterium]
MLDNRKIKSALLSVFCKEGLDEVVQYLSNNGVKIYSTGGTLSFIEELGASAQSVENLTGYPSILGGRVKTLHPKVFGGILARRDNPDDSKQLEQYEIPEVDLVIVDLYPFEKTLSSGASDAEIIEKIDIGGISLIRAAAKNYSDVAVVASRRQYAELLSMLKENNGGTTLANRKRLATQAFDVSSHYDSAIFSYFNRSERILSFKQSLHGATVLRYGENPHQKAVFYGNFASTFEQLHGKEISYNNLLDIDAAVRLIRDFDEPTFAILKHNNACGAASRPALLQAWTAALAGDPVSAFGGVLVCNRELDSATAEEVSKLFCEVVIAPAYSDEGLAILKQKKNRIILASKPFEPPMMQSRTLLNGMVMQEQDLWVETEKNMTFVTTARPTAEQVQDLIFANKLVKHSKSNAIVLAKDRQLVASGVGQTSRVDALRHAIEKAASFGFSLQGAVMASDAFFPFPDCVEIAHKAGIAAVIHPGGSVNDQKSVDYCNANGVAMVTTGVRHFKH